MLRDKVVDTDQDIRDRTKVANSLEIARNFIADGDSPERVARNTGLPLAKVKALLKKTKVKQIA
jgi:hypothetical protein